MKQVHIKMNLKDSTIKSLETVCDVADLRNVLEELKNFSSTQNVIKEEVSTIETEDDIESELHDIENEHCLNTDICAVQSKIELDKLFTEINEAYTKLIIARSKANKIHNKKLLNEAEHIKSRILYTKSYIYERVKTCNKLASIISDINKCKGIIIEINCPINCVKVLDSALFDLDGIKSNIKEDTYLELKDEIERLKELNNSKVAYLKSIAAIN